jgi:hypothetical protein
MNKVDRTGGNANTSRQYKRGGATLPWGSAIAARISADEIIKAKLIQNQIQRAIEKGTQAKGSIKTHKVGGFQAITATS